MINVKIQLSLPKEILIETLNLRQKKVLIGTMFLFTKPFIQKRFLMSILNLNITQLNQYFLSLNLVNYINFMIESQYRIAKKKNVYKYVSKMQALIILY